MRTLNRAAVMVVPKQPFLDWLRDVDPSNQDLTMEEVCADPSIYLLPECDLEDELLARLTQVSEEIFEQELAGWDRVEESWPKDRSFQVFQRWFGYSIHWMVIDLADERLVREKM